MFTFLTCYKFTCHVRVYKGFFIFLPFFNNKMKLIVTSVL
jgi:hypothetical protein